MALIQSGTLPTEAQIENGYLKVKTQSQTVNTRSDTFAATGSGVAVDVSANPTKSYTLLVSPIGPVTSWTVNLEGSLDGTYWETILTHTDADSGKTIFSGAASFPALYFRANCSALNLGSGTSITAKILGV